LGWFKKGESSGEQRKGQEDEIEFFFWRRIGELEVVVVENHILCFDITRF
jgi:hypothetical protein